jgi:outer membrane protein TolC
MRSAPNQTVWRRTAVVGLTVFVVLTPAALAAEAAGEALTIDGAIRHALSHHPSLRARRAVEHATEALTDITRAGLLPDIELTAQLNRATGNVVPGALFPQRGIPGVSGPARGRGLDGGAFGSAVGVSGSFDIVGYKQHVRQIDAALADQAHAHAGTDMRRLEIAFDAADRFIEAVLRGETVKTARASVARAKVFLTTVEGLVAGSLRPGVDLSRAQAERALADTQLARAEQSEAVARLELGLALGEGGHPITPLSGRLLKLPEVAPISAESTADPRRAEAAAGQAAAVKKQAVADLAYLPRLEAVGALWLRGSGLFAGGADLGPGKGLLPDAPNWGVGLVLTWPALELSATRARVRALAAHVEQAAAVSDEVTQAIAAQLATARAVLAGVERVATHTPTAVAAARAVERQATARYQAGLATVLEVAEAHRILEQAEIEDTVARLGIWRGLLLYARATGDLAPFVARAGGVDASPEGK